MKIDGSLLVGFLACKERQASSPIPNLKILTTMVLKCILRNSFVFSILLLVPIYGQNNINDVLTNEITKDSSSASAQSSSSSTAQANAGSQAPNPGGSPPPPPPPHHGPGGVGIPPQPPVFPGFGGGAGAGAGFHKSIDFSAGAGAGLGPLLAGLMPGYGAALPPPAVPPPVVGGNIPEVPPPIGGIGDSLLGGGAGYLGFPGFLGPSYVPYSWLGSALGAKGDLLFPIVIFVFVIFGIWTVVQFLLGLIVPLIAGKLALGKGLLAAKTGKFLRSIPESETINPMEEHHDKVLNLTQQVHSALDAHQQNATHKARTIF